MPRLPLYIASFEKYLSEREAEGLEPKTMETYRTQRDWIMDVARRLEFPSDQKKWTGQHLRLLEKDMLERHASTTTQCVATNCRAWLRWAKNPLAQNMKINVHGQRAEPLWLTMQERMTALELAAPRPWLQACLVILAYTGLRAGEAARLQVRHMHSEYIQVEAGKKGKSAPVFVDADFWAELEPYLAWRRSTGTKESRFLVHYYHGQLVTFTPNRISHLVRDFGAEIGIPMTAHAWRRSLAQDLHEAGSPLTGTQQLLRHSTAAQTQDYLRLEDRANQDNVRQFRPSYRRTPAQGGSPER